MSTPALVLKKTVVVLLPLLAAGLAWAAFIGPVQTYHEDLGAELDGKRDVVRRYQALIAQREQLKSDLARLSGEKSLQDFFHTAANANGGAALLQQKLSGIITANGGQLRVARVETKPKSGIFEPFAVNLTFAVSTVGLSKILLQVEAQKPLILVDTLLIRGGAALAHLQEAAPAAGQAPVTAEEPVLDVSLTVSGFLTPKG
jgi:hypothetical protein